MDIEVKISNLYDLISQKESEKHIVSELLFTIIQLKALKPNLYERTIYQDSKLFISTYISSIEERDLGYDIINTDKINRCINFINNVDEKYRLLNYAHRILKNNNYEEESIIIKNSLNKIKTKLLVDSKYYFGKYFHILMHLSSYSFWTLSLTIVSLFFITYIVLLPAPFENCSIFIITYKTYSTNFLVNHFINLISCLFDVNGNCQIATSSVVGVLLMIFIKLLYIVFIANYFYQKIIDFINKN
jgi:hypothetical protein